MDAPNTESNRESKKDLTVDWYRTRIDRKKLKQLTKKSDLRGALQTLGHLGILAGTGAAAYFSVGTLPVVATIAILFAHGTCYAFLSNGHHELCHRTVFKSRFLNELFLWFIGFISWHDHFLFRASHKRHHVYTLHPPDDLEVVLPIKLEARDILKRAFVNPVGFYQLMARYIRIASGRLKGDWEHILFPDSNWKERRNVFRYARLLLAGHAALTAVCFATGLWMIPVLTTFAPFYGGLLQFLCNSTQHIGLTDNTRDFRICCRTFELGPVLRFLYWQMNYHTEHHMYAAVPFYNLRKLHRLIEYDLPPTHKGLIRTWIEIFAILQKQKRDPDYQYEAPLPPTAHPKVA